MNHTRRAVGRRGGTSLICQDRPRPARAPARPAEAVGVDPHAGAGWCSCGPASERRAAAGAVAQHAEREAQRGRAACRARERRGGTGVVSESRRVLPLLSHGGTVASHIGIVMSVRGTPSRGGLGGSSLAGLRGRTAGAGRSSAADSRTYAKHGELTHRERHVCADHWNAVWLHLWGVTRRQWGCQLGGCRVEPSRFG